IFWSTPHAPRERGLDVWERGFRPRGAQLFRAVADPVIQCRPDAPSCSPAVMLLGKPAIQIRERAAVGGYGGPRGVKSGSPLPAAVGDRAGSSPRLIRW